MTKREKSKMFTKSVAVLLSSVMAFCMTPGGVGVVNAEEGVVIAPVATVTLDGVTTPFISLQDAFTAASDGGFITLMDDVTIGEDEELALSCGITIDLNGHTLTNNGMINDGQERPLSEGGTGAGLVFDCSNSGTPGTFNNAGMYNTDFQSFTADTFNFTAGSVPGYVCVDGGTINVTGGSLTGGFMVSNSGEADVAATISNDAEILLVGDSGVYVDMADEAPGLSVTLNGGYYNVPPTLVRGYEGQFAEYVTLDDACVEQYDSANPQSDWTADPEVYTWRVTSSKSSLETATIAAIPDQLFTGDPIEPELTVTLGGKTLTKGTDYTVSYVNNIRCGLNDKEAKAIITGIGEYSETNTEGFNIVGSEYNPSNIENAEIELLSIDDGSLETCDWGTVSGKIAKLRVTFDAQNGIKRYFVCATNSNEMKAATGNSPHVVIPNSQNAYWENHSPSGVSVVTTGANGEKIAQKSGQISVDVMVVNPFDQGDAPGFDNGEDITFYLAANSDNEMKSSPNEVKIAVPFDKNSVGKKYDEKGEVINSFNYSAPGLSFVTVNDITTDSSGKVTKGEVKQTVGFTIDPGLNEAEFYAVGVSADGTLSGLATWPQTTIRPTDGGDYPEEVAWVVDPDNGANAYTYSFAVATLAEGDTQHVNTESDGTKYINGVKEGDKIIVYATGSYFDGKRWQETKESNVIEYVVTKDSIGKTFTKTENPDNPDKPDNPDNPDKPDNPEKKDPVKINDANVTVADQTYTGEALTPALTVKVGDKTLKQGTDYDVKYSDNINAGTAKYVVTGKGDFTGSKEGTFKINPLAVNKDNVSVSAKNATYNGKEQKTTVTVTYGKNTLKEGTDYDVTYPKNVKNAGSYKLTVNFKNNYSGSQETTFVISKAANTLKAKAKKHTIKLQQLNKKKKIIIKKAKAFKVSKGVGKVTYKKTSGNKKITVSKSGKITVKKGLKKGNYTVKVKVTAAGDKNYKKGTKNVQFKIVVK